MKTGRYAVSAAIVLLACATLSACLHFEDGGDSCVANAESQPDSMAMVSARIDSVLPAADTATRYTTLTDEDFRRVAAELHVEVPAIKAVVLVEAGKAMEGFWGPGSPVVNCDRSLWSIAGRKVKNRAKAPANTQIPKGLKHAFARRAWQRLINARKICIEQADLSTFWGMFQIGGFNYRLCGCDSIQEFVRLMSHSELEQLELFAAMLTNTGQVKYLRAKNWSAFARAYNGPSYRRKGYHTRIARAYNKFKNAAKSAP